MKEDLTNKELEIKDAAKDMSFDVDTASLWSSIEPKLPPVKENNRKPVWWLITGLFLATLFTSATLWLMPSSDGEPNNESNVTTNPITSLQEQPSVTGYTKAQPSTSAKVSTNNNNINQQKLTHSQPINYDDAYSHNTMNSSSDIQASHSESRDIATIDYQSATGTHSATTTLHIPSKKIVNSIDQNINQIKRSPLQGVSYIQLIDNQPLVNFNTYEINLPAIEPAKVDTWLPYWQAYAGINTSVSKTNFNVSQEGITPMDYEQNLVGFSQSIAYGKENSKGWRFFAGLSYDKLFTRYSNTDRTVISGNETGESSKVIDTQGNISIVVGDIEVNTIIQNDITWHRSHDYLNLQLGLGKRLLLTDRISITGDGYSIYNIWSRHSGYYFEDESPTIVKFEAKDNHPYQNQGLGIGGRLTIEYDLGLFSIGLSSLYEKSLNTIISNNHHQIKNSHYGVQLGVVYRP